MSAFGKVFIFENNLEQNQLLRQEMEAQGFLIFGFNNLYQLLQYSGEINPDIVIMNFSDNFLPDSQTWKNVEKILCGKTCPEVYLNASAKFQNNQNFHQVEFNSNTLKKDQILSIIKKNQTNYLH